MIDFKIIDKSGIKLKTANKYVTEDLAVTLTDNDINNIVPENIAKNVTILGVAGTFKGGAELNIAYGNTAPEDTSKLWVKTSEPSNVLVSASQFGNGSLETGISSLPTGATGIASGVVGTKIYLFGGDSSGGRLNTINCYTISLPLTSNNLLLQQSLTDNLFNLINNESITLSTGVKAVYKGNSNNEGELVEALLYKNSEWTNI